MEYLGSLVLNNTYRDSVFLMKISSKVSKLDGVILASAMMATERNKDLMKASGIYDNFIETAQSDDLVIGIRTENDNSLQVALELANSLLSESNKEKEEKSEFRIKRIEHAIQVEKGINMCLISVAGDYAKYEAAKALANNMNVMLYSDNISVSDELSLKQLAHSKNLIVMGPDCGTAIINSVPLAFANAVRKGKIGIVGASGTGMQEISSIVHRYGGGISNAIGTGGRDIKESIGGITMIDALEMLENDPSTEVLVIVSKPPSKLVKDKVTSFIHRSSKPVVVNFAGEICYDEIVQASGKGCYSLEEASFEALRLAGYSIENPDMFSGIDIGKLNNDISSLSSSQKYLRGIYSGGSLCYEAMHLSNLALKKNIYSNTPTNGISELENVNSSYMHTFLDMGDDQFTVGKPHPMIDPTDKVKRLVLESDLQDVAVILTDCVTGYGSCEDPAGMLYDGLKFLREKHLKEGRNVIVIASVCGTEEDPQAYSQQSDRLKSAGIYVANSNYQAAKLAIYVMEKLGTRRS